MKNKYLLIFWLFALSGCSCRGQSIGFGLSREMDTNFMCGADRDKEYLPKLKDKKVGVVANQTSRTRNTHLVDFLLKKNVNVIKVFAPEHGFRGEAGPGDEVASGKDKVTGLPMVSLYGANKKPAAKDLEGLDIVVFDIQDVGARFYTYISTLHLLMEACAENKIPVMILDRPNPNGFYIDGPVLDTAFSSFVGMDPIPVVHGLTVGEYAKMVNGEKWLKNGIQCDLTVIEMSGYTHDMKYQLPVAPSPNLPNMQSVYLYPSLCFFEGTAVSVGRGTQYPFQMIGYPGYEKGIVEFTPQDIPGVIKDPPYKGKLCKGLRLQPDTMPRIKLEYLIDMYNDYPDKDKFFTNFFERLAGTDQLRKQIIAGLSAEEIRERWKPELEKYREMRKKYVLYPDI